MNSLLAEKVAIVTGGGKGLGLAIAMALAVDGAKVLLCSRSEERCRAAVLRIQAKGGTAAAYPADITVPGIAEALVREAVTVFGKLDIVINCAGIFIWKKFLDVTRADWDDTIATNLSAPFHLTQAAARVMIDQGRGGSIINITSVHGSIGDPNVIPQCASKFGLAGMTWATAEALREFDIRVNAISPGAIEPDTPEKRGESPRKKVTQADIATLAVYLASDLARSLTGMTMDAHGSTRRMIKA